jgi:hypothetical protein
MLSPSWRTMPPASASTPGKPRTTPSMHRGVGILVCSVALTYTCRITLWLYSLVLPSPLVLLCPPPLLPSMARCSILKRRTAAFAQDTIVNRFLCSRAPLYYSAVSRAEALILITQDLVYHLVPPVQNHHLDASRALLIVHKEWQKACNVCSYAYLGFKRATARSFLVQELVQGRTSTSGQADCTTDACLG